MAKNKNKILRKALYIFFKSNSINRHYEGGRTKAISILLDFIKRLLHFVFNDGATLGIVLSLCILFSFGCNYSFTGASIDYNKVKTISIDNFPNYAPLASPTLSQSFTETLKDVFTSQTNLTLVKNNGDLFLSGKITGYSTSPVAIQKNETAALTRLTITVHVIYKNTKDESQNFEKDFSQYADYDNSKSFSSVENELIDKIDKQLAQDIFNSALSNW